MFTKLYSQADAIQQVSSIHRMSHILIKTQADLEKVVETPLLQACKILYDKNIKTTWSSANAEFKSRGDDRIFIDFDPHTLSTENRTLIEKLGGKYNQQLKTLSFSMPYHKELLISDIEKYFIAFANSLKQQAPLWIPFYKKNELHKKFRTISVSEHQSLYQNPNTAHTRKAPFLPIVTQTGTEYIIAPPKVYIYKWVRLLIKDKISLTEIFAKMHLVFTAKIDLFLLLHSKTKKLQSSKLGALKLYTVDGKYFFHSIEHYQKVSDYFAHDLRKAATARKLSWVLDYEA